MYINETHTPAWAAVFGTESSARLENTSVSFIFKLSVAWSSRPKAAGCLMRTPSVLQSAIRSLQTRVLSTQSQTHSVYSEKQSCQNFQSRAEISAKYVKYRQGTNDIYALGEGARFEYLPTETLHQLRKMKHWHKCLPNHKRGRKISLGLGDGGLHISPDCMLLRELF